MASTRNFDRVSVSRPSCIALRSSTAVAVEVNRCMAWTFSLQGSTYQQVVRLESGSRQLYARLVSSFRRLELLPQVFIAQLGIATELEDDEANGGFGKDEHFREGPVVLWMKTTGGSGGLKRLRRSLLPPVENLLAV